MPRRPNSKHATLLRIQKHADAISRNGTLAVRREPGRTPATVLRFRDRSAADGRVIQHSISLGQCRELIEAVRKLVTDRNTRRAQVTEARKEQRLLRKTQRLREFILRHQIGHSRRFRQKAVREYRAMVEDGTAPSLGEFFDLLEGGLVRQSRRGRPYAHRLW